MKSPMRTSTSSASSARHILQLKAGICKDQLINASMRCNLSQQISKRPLRSSHRSSTLKEETADQIGLKSKFAEITFSHINNDYIKIPRQTKRKIFYFLVNY